MPAMCMSAIDRFVWWKKEGKVAIFLTPAFNVGKITRHVTRELAEDGGIEVLRLRFLPEEAGRRWATIFLGNIPPAPDLSLASLKLYSA